MSDRSEAIWAMKRLVDSDPSDLWTRSIVRRRLYEMDLDELDRPHAAARKSEEA